MTYDGDLQRVLDLLFYQDRARDTISSKDEDVLQIFSGDEQAARNGIETFLERHEDRAWVVSDTDSLEVKVSGLFKDPKEHVLKERYVKRQKRFREGRWPEPRPSKKGEKR
jgi:hypothetical protein